MAWCCQLTHALLSATFGKEGDFLFVFGQNIGLKFSLIALKRISKCVLLQKMNLMILF